MRPLILLCFSAFSYGPSCASRRLSRQIHTRTCKQDTEKREKSIRGLSALAGPSAFSYGPGCASKRLRAQVYTHALASKKSTNQFTGPLR